MNNIFFCDYKFFLMMIFSPVVFINHMIRLTNDNLEKRVSIVILSLLLSNTAARYILSAV